MSFKVEADFITQAGLRAVVIYITRNEENSWRCGYVGVPKGHSAYNVDYNNLNVDVHGGLTFDGMGEDYPVEVEKDSIWWLGYDCNHLYDEYEGGQSLDYCINQCESLARQLMNKEGNENEL